MSEFQKTISQAVRISQSTGPVGQSVVREDAVVKATGRAVYAADITRPDMLYGKVLLSTEAHALIKNIDTSAAKNIPGVHAVLTARDIPGENVYGIAVADQQVLAEKKVRFFGEPVALVAAETPEIAEAALKEIKVAYEPLEGVFNPIDALKEGAPKVHEAGNLLLHTRVRKGDYRIGFEQADVIVENLFRTHGQDHSPLEPESGVAWFDGDGILNIYSSSQYIFRDRKQVGRVLNIPINRIHSVNTTVGGGFGRKDDVTVEILVSLLAWATQKPVKLVYTRHESMLTQTHRHPTIVRIRSGATASGKLTALEAVVYGDTGAYASLGIYVIKKMALHIGGPYYYPHYKADSFSVYTNNPIAGAFRGFGILQAATVHEVQMDELARRLGMDPIEFRLQNCLREGLTFSTGQVMDQACGIAATLEELREYVKRHGLQFKKHPEHQEVER
ncbi:MAG: molybdopterin-dependent oxidoreductase [Anaerolineae bacterium]|nr:molybdopterin-dependent oxidoreductase [Anaerolineae bacterium]